MYDPSYGITGAPATWDFVPADQDKPPTKNFPGIEDDDWNSNLKQDGAASLQSGPGLTATPERNTWKP